MGHVLSVLFLFVFLYTAFCFDCASLKLSFVPFPLLEARYKPYIYNASTKQDPFQPVPLIGGECHHHSSVFTGGW